jgi:hypothetical protein
MLYFLDVVFVFSLIAIWLNIGAMVLFKNRELILSRYSKYPKGICLQLFFVLLEVVFWPLNLR